MWRNLRWRMLRALVSWELGWLTPASANWPLALGRTVARLRGWLNTRLDLDWKSASLCHHYVSGRLAEAYAQIAATADQQTLHRLTRERFSTGAREEWEAGLTMKNRLGELRVQFENEAPLLERYRSGRGVVVLGAHLDSAPLGISSLGYLGVPVHMMTSSVILDPRVPLAVQEFFTTKYAAMQRHFNGGFFAHAESHLKSIYAALDKGGWVVILGDAPGAADKNGLPIPFFGQTRLFAPGPVRIARRARADMVAMVCLFEGGANYRVKFSNVVPESRIDDPQAIAGLYGFIEDHIRQFPGRWWAAEQLPAFPIEGRVNAD